MTYAKNLGWGDDELRVWDIQYRSQPIKFIDDTNLSPHTKGLLFKISVITGWIISEVKEERMFLYDQFQKKLREDYYSLNLEEIEYAIRSEGTKIKDWGKAINLSMIDEVLHPYILRRAEVRKLEEGAIKQIQIAEPVEPLEPEKWIELVKDLFLKTGLVGLIPAPIYDLLEQSKEIELSLEEKKAIRAGVERRLMNEATEQGLGAIRKFKDLKANKKDYEILVKNECKKQSVANYFIKQQAIDEF